MVRNTVRVVAAMVLLAGVLALMGAPASAGTLTGSSFTATGASALINATNAQYNWSFTTATSATLRRVTMSVPPGTDCPERYLDMQRGYAVSGDATTPDSSANSITGDMEIRAKIASYAWVGGSFQPILAKMGATDAGYSLGIDNTGKLTFTTSNNGSTKTYWTGSALGYADGYLQWVRATYQRSTGVVNFYTSPNGTDWNSAGSQTRGAQALLNDSSLPLKAGSDNWSSSFFGKIYSVELRDGIGGTVVSNFNPTADAIAGTSWVATTGETWTVNRVGTNLPVDIRCDLTVASYTGIPVSFRVGYRMIDGLVYYFFASTAVSPGTSMSLSLSGFTSTATPGSYTSVITTWDNSATPVARDTVTTAALTFTDGAALSLHAVIAPTLMFTVAGRGTACNGQSAANFQGGSTGSAVTLGQVAQASTGGGAQDLNVSSNAGLGFAVYIRTTGATPDSLRDSFSRSIADVAGTAASPGTAPTAGTAGFGYTTNDASTAFTNNTFAKLTNTNETVLLASPGTTSKAACVGFQVAVASNTTASTYTSTVVYTAVPVY